MNKDDRDTADAGPLLTVTEDSLGHSISTSWSPPAGITVDTSDGMMAPDRVDASWLLIPSARGPERGKVTCFGSPRRGPVSHTFWGYGGVMAASPEWAQGLSHLVYDEATGADGADRAVPGFTRTASARSRWLERRFTLADAPPVSSTLHRGRMFVPLSGMISWSLGSGEPDRTTVWLWGTGYESAEYRNAVGTPNWIRDEHAAVRSALEAASVPPGWETHEPMIRPDRLQRG